LLKNRNFAQRSNFCSKIEFLSTIVYNRNYFSIPGNADAYFWLTYEQQLTRRDDAYEYQTNINTYEEVKELQVFVNIKESRPLVHTEVIVTSNNNTLPIKAISSLTYTNTGKVTLSRKESKYALAEKKFAETSGKIKNQLDVVF